MHTDRFVPTMADAQIEDCLRSDQSFSMVAGAGSGKTRSLIQALSYLRNNYGTHLRRHGKRIACITYTKRAVDVIAGRLDWDALFQISTIHSFLWGEIKRLSDSIRQSLVQHIIPEYIARKTEEDDGGTS